MVMTSPGLIDLSASSTMPLTKLATIFCRPRPTPTPTAPVATASTDRSMPDALSTTMMAIAIMAMRMSLPSSTCMDGVRSGDACTRRSRKLLTAVAAQIASSSSTVVLRISSGVTRRPPSTIARESSAATVPSSRPMMLSAAMVQAVTATTRLMKWLRIRLVRIAITTQAVARLFATISR